MSGQPESSTHENQLPLMAAYCALLGIAQYGLYSVNFRQFFQGDAIFWMYYRFHSLGEFLRALGGLDVANWYRPLSNRIIPSLFYPLWGMQPYGYHLVVFVCFFVVSCLVFAFLKYLTGKISTAFLAAFYFSVHSNNVYTAYDFAFAPELFYVFFYVSSVWLFIEGERRESRGWRAVSVLSFALSLMSKEAAVTLPAVLVLSYFFFINNKDRGGLWRALRAIGFHLAVWIAYLVYIVGYLRVGSGDYMLSPGNVMRNLLTGIFYAFNLRRDGWMPTRVASGFVLAFLVVFALSFAVLAARLLFRQERRLVAYGALWFVIGLSPMLMLNALGPYYLYLAMVGFSLIVGMSLSLLQGYLRVVLLLLIWISCRNMIVTDTAGDTALGYASKWAQNSADDILKARPQLQPGASIYILDQSIPDLWRFHGLGTLFKLLYHDESVVTSYRSTGQSPAPDSGELVVMKAEAEHLVDVTAEFRENPAKFLGGVDESSIRYVERAGVSLSVTPEEVVAGRDFYWLSVSGWGLPDVIVQYTVNDGPVAEGAFHLNSDGKVRFFVSKLTPVGVFRFLRFRSPASSPTEWIRAGATLRVQPPDGR